jgi:phage anti-repressor protein
MNSDKLVQLRLSNHHISDKKFKTAKEIVARMGAIQAQDYNMAKWAVGIRLPGSTDRIVEESIDKGDVIRTHLLRPTWHLVSADDIYWMLELTAPQIKTLMRSRNKQLGLTDDIFAKCNDILENALSRGRYLTREELEVELAGEIANAKTTTEGSRLSHILMQAELDGIICNGPRRGKKITYSLLSERVPETELISRAEAVLKLASRYFTSHGPATLQDFAWWSGLSVTEARPALESLGTDFVSEKTGSHTYWFPRPEHETENIENTVHLLPAFDELIISYRDRNAFLPSEDHSKAISNNGLFKPVILVNGKVAGIWKRTMKKDRVIIEPQFFQSPVEDMMKMFESAAVRYGDFLGHEVEIINE